MTDAEVLVVGGGPAGCAAATLLAQWGHAVTLITRPAGDTPVLAESIPPSTRKLFDVLGLTARIEAADVIRSTGNTVWWGSATPRVESFVAGQHGWQITTTELETVVQAVAAESGVRFEVDRCDAATITARRPPFILDCTGRAGILARARRLRVPDPAALTVAMAGIWRASRFHVPDATHTVIESYDGGWIWSVPQTVTTRFVAVMVDPRVSTLTRAAASRDVYLAEVGKAAEFRRILQDAALTDGPRGWNASMYHATRYVDDNVLLVGDAGSFIDPLSSAGIKKALASGWLAAVATHTSLTNPPMQAAALDFFEGRERSVYASFRRLTDRYWKDAAAGHDHPFWNDRTGDSQVDVDGDEMARAFERVRSASTLRLAIDPRTTVVERPVVSGREIVLEPHLARDGTHDARYAFDVDLLGLVKLAPDYASVPDLYEAYSRRHGAVALPAFLAALAAAIAQQWLRWCDTR